MSSPRTRFMTRRRSLSAGLVVASLPMLLASAPGASTTAGPGGDWSALWLSATTTGTTGNSLATVRQVINAASGTAATLTGSGVGIALIDTGVAPVPGLPKTQVVNGPDLSFESQGSTLRYLDTYGHGTHRAGIMIANDTATGTKGLAPGAKVTSIKVGTSNGAVDATQVIAAIDWVVENKNYDSAYPIRVINLSYGTGGNSDYWTDPVQFAVEQAWAAGIVVVAAAGNGGNNTTQLSNPATDPFVISVGSTSTKGTVSTTDDSLSTFTNQNVTYSGKGLDLLAPGESILSLRDPGSNVDEKYATARSGETLFRGSGTSQAAAVVSSAVALLLQKRPTLTPDQVKHLLFHKGSNITQGTYANRGYKQLNLNNAIAGVLPTDPKLVTQSFGRSSGLGPIERARGSSHAVSSSTTLSGEKTPYGSWSSANWSKASAARTAWTGGVWMGVRLAGDGFTGTSFASRTWASTTWSGAAWSGDAWTDPKWSGRYWSGRYWSGTGWSGRYWSSEDWSTAHWG